MTTFTDKEPEYRHITRIGFYSMAAWGLILAGLAMVHPEPFIHAWKLVLGQMMAGRAYSVSAGIDMAFPKGFLLLQVALQDIIVLLLLYKLLIAGYNRVEKVPVIGTTFAKIHASASRHKNRVEPFGAVGVALFVLFPFWATGPLAGSVLGYMLGIRTWLVFASVIIGNFMSVACWILFFDTLHTFMTQIGARLPMSLPLMILVTVVAVACVCRLWSLRGRMAGTLRTPPQPTERDGDKAVSG
ncbi:MAG: small multi-drug export protein [bacterium]|nr:small multi-drug export protein [bacterium]